MITNQPTNIGEATYCVIFSLSKISYLTSQIYPLFHSLLVWPIWWPEFLHFTCFVNLGHVNLNFPSDISNLRYVNLTAIGSGAYGQVWLPPKVFLLLMVLWNICYSAHYSHNFQSLHRSALLRTQAWGVLMANSSRWLKNSRNHPPLWFFYH